MKIFKNIKFDTNPILIASWVGMGKVGLIAANYLRKKINAQLLAEIDMTPYFIPEAVFAHNGIIDPVIMPTAKIYFSKKPDVLIFESDMQIGGKEALSVAKTLMLFAEEMGVKQVFTIAAFPQNISHKTETKIFGAFTEQALSLEFEKLGVTPMTDGYIAGLNGVLLGIAKSRSIDGGCFLGTMPFFAVNMNYPKTSLKIVELLEDVLNIDIDKNDINESIVASDNQFMMIEEQIRQFPPRIIGQQQQEINPLDEIWDGQLANENYHEVVPQVITEKIERLFLDAQNDKTRATTLKKELDRWNVYELYEDRFLKLFKLDGEQK